MNVVEQFSCLCNGNKDVLLNETLLQIEGYFKAVGANSVDYLQCLRDIIDHVLVKPVLRFDGEESVNFAAIGGDIPANLHQAIYVPCHRLIVVVNAASKRTQAHRGAALLAHLQCPLKHTKRLRTNPIIRVDQLQSQLAMPIRGAKHGDSHSCLLHCTF